MKTKLVLLSLALWMAAAAGPSTQGESPRSLIGKTAPKLVVENWANTNGKELVLEKLRGKVVVVDFWAYW